MKKRNIFKNSSGFSVFEITCVCDLNATKIPTLARHKTHRHG